MSDKVLVKEDEYFDLCDMMDKMYYKAYEYAPTIEEIQNIIIPHLSYFLYLLLWIDETGVETEENAESRKMIRKLIMDKMILY